MVDSSRLVDFLQERLRRRPGEPEPDPATLGHSLPARPARPPEPERPSGVFCCAAWLESAREAYWLVLFLL